MNLLSDFFSHFIQPDIRTALLVVVNLVIIESLLSVDNAAVLATLVMHLHKTQRNRALRIGIVFAYVFRGAALIFASWLIKIAWLKLLGGLYLIYLFAEFWAGKLFSKESEGSTKKYTRAKRKLPGLSAFWSAVVMVELMDLAFSIDNVFAAVAFTKNIYLICTGVFVGIISMRVVAGYFVKLMEKFPFLDTVAFVIIGILGLRLCSDFFCAYLPDNALCSLLATGRMEFYFSIATAVIFFLPIVSSLVFNFPGRKK